MRNKFYLLELFLLIIQIHARAQCAPHTHSKKINIFDFAIKINENCCSYSLVMCLFALQCIVSYCCCWWWLCSCLYCILVICIEKATKRRTIHYNNNIQQNISRISNHWARERIHVFTSSSMPWNSLFVLSKSNVVVVIVIVVAHIFTVYCSLFCCCCDFFSHLNNITNQHKIRLE